MSNLKQRTVSSILYGTFLLLPMVLHPMGLVINMLFFLVLSCIEYFKLIQDQFKIKGKFLVLIYTLMTASLFLVIVYSFLFIPEYLLYIAILSVLYSIILTLRLFQRKFPFPTLLLNGLLYIGIPCSLWVCAGFIFDPYYPWFVIALISLIWANDVFAYLFGSAIGKNKLAPYISPGKTIEGSTAGILCAILWSLVIAFFDHKLPNAY